jgi:hypothetical protein
MKHSAIGEGKAAILKVVRHCRLITTATAIAVAPIQCQ